VSSTRLHLTDLPWLPRTPADFRARLRDVAERPAADAGRALQALAGSAIGLNQSISLAQTLQRLTAAAPVSGLAPFRLGVVSNATTSFLKPALIGAALRYGVALDVVVADFGQLEQEAFDPAGVINVARPDAILLAIDHRGLPFRSPGADAWPVYRAEPAIEAFTTIRNGFRAHAGATCIVQSLPAPTEVLFGSLDMAAAGTLRAATAAFNAHLVAECVRGGDILADVDWLAQRVGLDEWYDDRHWYLSRLPFSQRALPLYADYIARIVGAMRGKSRKCLVLDLDNTIWGGVIGDDGLDGIALHPGDGRGEAFRAVQTLALDLRRRGIVLAVCSKNDESIARQAFREHSGMMLREQDIAVFMANWDDKATNLERIAERLELGLDALVFLDDNPVERAQVRGALPQVAVPELPDDASEYARLLAVAGYFESVAFTSDDLARADQYRGNAERARVLEGSRNVDEFLRSLDMEITLGPFLPAGRKRIAQLINKTNQFNVTTRRYTEQQVAALEDSAEHYTLQVSVRDRFGDNGMISVVICERGAEEWRIDSWLMSCRVLNRKVEEAVCSRIARDARAAGAKRLAGLYIPTDRNGIVRNLYARLGFEAAGTQDGTERWLLDLGRYVPPELLLRFVEQPAPAQAP
jgi:FkbH-like protein